MRSMTKAWPAVLAAAAFAVALPACGEDEAEQRLDDAAEDVRREGEELGKDAKREGEELGKDAKREGEELGKDAKREADEAVD